MINEEIITKTQEEIKLRGLSKATEIEYLGKLRLFIKYYHDRPLEEMSETEIRAFLLYLINEKKVATGTVNIYNSALRFVFGAVLERTLNYQMIPRRRIHRELPDIMSKPDIAKLFSTINNLRDKTILMTIYGAGLRASEVTHLRKQDIDSENMRIFVHQGKGGKDRYTLLSSANLEVLREYWLVYRPSHPEGYLFYPQHPNVDKNRILTTTAVQSAMKKHLKTANISGKYTPRTLRHCFATHLLEAGVDVTRIKQLMGHTHIQSTTFYLHLLNFDGSIRSPLDSLPKKRGRKAKAVDEIA
jgi:site-specific recombinase XerD